jgi:phage head maturation protease
MESDNPNREVLTRSVVAAAERGDRLAFASAVQRYGSLKEAQEIARNKAVLRMVDRVAAVAAFDVPALPCIEVRATNGAAADGDHLYGHFTVWDAWYEVDSFFEGHFLERTVKGSTKKTLNENRDSIRALFQHGMDPLAGDKPLGPIDELHEDDVGAYYDVALLREDGGDFVDYVRGIVPGLRDGLYGASFRFRAMREEFNYDAEASDHNPDGLPERTLKEMQVMEFGPVTFPASSAATASVRSREESANGNGAEEVPVAPPDPDAAATGRTSGNERREVANRFRTREEWQQWLTSQ